MSIFNLSCAGSPTAGDVLNIKSAVIPSLVACLVVACIDAASPPFLSSDESAVDINLTCPIKSPSWSLALLSLEAFNITSLPVAAPAVLFIVVSILPSLLCFFLQKTCSKREPEISFSWVI